MSDAPCCPHGPEFRTFNEKWGYGCKKFLGEGVPGANQRGYCSWKPPKPNGAARPGSSVSTARNYGKSPEESRSIVAQVAMKCAVELYCSAFSIAPAAERQALLAELISAANRINENIGRMAEPRREPQPQREPVNTWTEGPPIDDAEADRWGS